MGRLLKAIVFITVLGFLALVGYAYLGDLSPAITEVNLPIELDAK